MSNKKLQSRQRIRKSIRKNVSGTAEKPRLAVFRSNKHISAQMVNDVKGVTLAAITSNAKDLADIKGTKSEVAQKTGEVFAEKAIKAGISEVVFDRSGYRYHGRVKAFAEGARKGGLKF
jgi:large subunit ribosomal protein L18